MKPIVVNSIMVGILCHLCFKARAKPQKSECKYCLLASFLQFFMVYCKVLVVYAGFFQLLPVSNRSILASIEL